MLAGGRELANRPAVVDVPRGKGHVLLFANNPVWRNATQGSYFLLFNALLNYDHLGVGVGCGESDGEVDGGVAEDSGLGLGIQAGYSHRQRRDR